jgi:cache domain-containing protein
MRFTYTRSISKVLFLGMFFFSTISIASVGMIWVVKEVDQFDRHSDRLRLKYVEDQKYLIKTEVLRAVNLVDYGINQTEIILQESIKNRVYESHALATNLYNQFHKSRSKNELKRIIVEALRSIRFNNGRGSNVRLGFCATLSFLFGFCFFRDTFFCFRQFCFS